MKKWLLICSCLIFATVLSACSSADAPVEPLLESTSRFTLTLLVSGEGSVTATTDSGIFGGTRTTTYRVSSRPYRISLPKGTRVSLRGNADSVSWGGPKIPSLPCLSSLRTCNFTLTQSVTQHVSLSKAKSNKLEGRSCWQPQWSNYRGGHRLRRRCNALHKHRQRGQHCYALRKWSRRSHLDR